MLANDYESLYSQSTSVDELINDRGPSGTRFNALRAELKKIVASENSSDINRMLISFLKELFMQCLRDHGLPPTIPMELCLAGSLARNQATPFSDIDCFLIFNDRVTQAEREAVIAASRKLFFLADKLFEAGRQFAMDPIGISISQLNGSVQDIFERITEEEPDVSMKTISICNAKSVFGKHDLLDQLQQKLQMEHKISEEYFFNMALNDFIGPRSRDKVDLKRDLIRPIDFILHGFRQANNLSPQEYDNYAKILGYMVDHQIMTPRMAALIDYISSETYQLRLNLHKGKMKESDLIENPGEKIKQLVNLVGWLRGSLQAYRASGEKTLDLCPNRQGFKSSIIYDEALPPEFEENITQRILPSAAERFSKDSSKDEEKTPAAETHSSLIDQLKNGISQIRRPANLEQLVNLPFVFNMAGFLLTLPMNELLRFSKLNLTEMNGYSDAQLTTELSNQGFQSLIAAFKANKLFDLENLKKQQKFINDLSPPDENSLKMVTAIMQSNLAREFYRNLGKYYSTFITSGLFDAGSLSRIFNNIKQLVPELASTEFTREASSIFEAMRLEPQAFQHWGSDKKNELVEFFKPLVKEFLINQIAPQVLDPSGKIWPELRDFLLLDYLSLNEKQLDYFKSKMIESLFVNAAYSHPFKQLTNVSIVVNQLFKDPEFISQCIREYSSITPASRIQLFKKIDQPKLTQINQFLEQELPQLIPVNSEKSKSDDFKKSLKDALTNTNLTPTARFGRLYLLKETLTVENFMRQLSKEKKWPESCTTIAECLKQIDEKYADVFFEKEVSPIIKKELVDKLINHPEDFPFKLANNEIDELSKQMAKQILYRHVLGPQLLSLIDTQKTHIKGVRTGALFTQLKPTNTYKKVCKIRRLLDNLTASSDPKKAQAELERRCKEVNIQFKDRNAVESIINRVISEKKTGQNQTESKASSEAESSNTREHP